MFLSNKADAPKISIDDGLYAGLLYATGIIGLLFYFFFSLSPRKEPRVIQRNIHGSPAGLDDIRFDK